MTKSRAIGIFDSGVGGLTVFKEVTRRLPDEKIIYLGDTARVPYGIKSSETVTKYSRQNSHFLQRKQVKLLVVACNTASALCLSTLQEELDIPVIGVIEPGAKAAADITSQKKVGVIGTEATINSGAYTVAIQALNPSIQVLSLPCPLFVPLTEEGWISGTIAEMIARKYLEELKGKIDTLVLGCTHYPILKKIIQSVVGSNVMLVDSAEETARKVEEVLSHHGLFSKSKEDSEFFASDNPKRFEAVGQRFLGKNVISNVQKVELDNY